MSKIFFFWKDEYSVGVKEIDRQHIKIVEMLNDLYTAYMQNDYNKKNKEVLSALADYSIHHFKTEEKYFHQFGFEHAIEHIKEHQDFKEKVAIFRKAYDENKSALTLSMINFLREWLNHHILIEDKKYSECFIKNGLH